ncbi:putative gustatory receptor 28b [Lutzomyia longipalpis]|nr:putative gustatory receptor 28b [Lutzomyia longipalpis]
MKLKQSIIGYFLASDITTVGDSFQFVMSLASIFAVYLCCLIKRNRLVELFANITDIDENSLKLGVFFGHYRRTMMLIWTNMAVMFIILSIHVTGSYMLLHRASIYPEMSVFVAFFFPFYLMCLSIIFHGCLMRQIRARFALLNGTLKELREEEGSKDISRIHPLNSAFKTVNAINRNDGHSLDFKLSLIIENHNSLFECCTAIQDYFSIQMLSSITIAFLSIVLNAFYIIAMALGSSQIKISVGSVEFMLFFTYYLAMCLLGVVHIGRGTSSVIDEVTKIPVNVFKLLYVVKDEECREKLKIFSNNLLHTKVKFTASDLFSLDKTIILTVIGTAATYLLILIQLAIPEEANHAEDQTDNLAEL